MKRMLARGACAAALCLNLAAVADAAPSALPVPPVPAGPSAQPLDLARKPESLDAEWRAHLCALLPQPCNVQSLSLYRARGAAPGDFVLLSEEPLALARVRRAADARAWALDRLHDFRPYAAALAGRTEAGAPELRLSLAPALYPLANGQWAVAVLKTVSEMYSGGGASFNTADFVPLDGAAGKAVHADIPFGCSRMIRACFSEKEYKTSKHCHDESSGSLRIAYGAPTRAGGNYDWQYTWLQTEWPAHEAASASNTTRIRFADSTTERAGFCGGPQ